ncbi:hypothetical protein GCM10020219_042690 [Nonomuraea dietziae]
MPRGRLRVYLGAAPGVGKTFAMLGEGRRAKERGRDVVVGLVETHGRLHTEELLEGMEVIPRRRLVHRGATFTELDVDAVIARAPKIVLIDELAHTNVPGSRNVKRWQDIEQILDAGINVISTVNVQHLESLNDVVQQITGVPQRETVPDEVVRPRRPDRAGRHVTRGPAQKDGTRQRLRPGEGRCRPVQLLQSRQPHRSERAGPALGRGQGRRAARPLPGRSRHRHHLGGARAGRRGPDRRAGR